MSISLSHNAFSGSCRAFAELQAFICTSAGGSWPPHKDPELDPALWYIDDSWSDQRAFLRFLGCSDVEDQFTPVECKDIAKNLKELLPAMEELAMIRQPHGQLISMGGYMAAVKKLIAGFQAAATAGEVLILQ